jgi:phosphatidate phosphatase APP1
VTRGAVAIRRDWLFQASLDKRQHKRRWLVEPYIGYGTPSRLLLSGRVLRDRGVILSSELDSRWRNLRNTFRRFRTGELAGARVRARFDRFEARAVTDGEGYFWAEIDLPEPLATSSWQALDVELFHSDDGSAPVAAAKAEVLVPPESARFGVISDIDDTVVTTNVTSTLQMLTTVLFSNAYVRTPFEGIAAFYRALQHGATGAEGNPIFYVSNGPWNFYGLLVEFFRLNGVPLGPLFLRDFGMHMAFSFKRSHGGHKLAHIERILTMYDRLPFVLIGDSGERDPEIYTEVVRRHPRRIRAIYIRSVDQRPERLSAIAALAEEVRKTATQFVLAPDSAFAAAHAAGEGLIDSGALPEIGAESQ